MMNRRQLVGAAGAALLAGVPKARAAIYDLSLIHISEPTRPY